MKKLLILMFVQSSPLFAAFYALDLIETNNVQYENLVVNNSDSNFDRKEQPLFFNPAFLIDAKVEAGQTVLNYYENVLNEKNRILEDLSLSSSFSSLHFGNGKAKIWFKNLFMKMRVNHQLDYYNPKKWYKNYLSHKFIPFGWGNEINHSELDFYFHNYEVPKYSDNPEDASFKIKLNRK